MPSPLKLRRPRDGRATAGNPDDYDVLSGQRAIGRILRTRTLQDRPHGRPRMIGVDVGRYGFIGRNSHHLLSAGLPAQTRLTHRRASSRPERSRCLQSGMQ
jgi:hypothetical protein